MTSVDIELSGRRGLEERLEELKNKYAENPIYAVGTNVEYAVYLEFGTRDMPPYPFFKPAIREFQANPKSFILDRTDKDSLDEIESTKEMVEAVAVSLKVQIQTNATAEMSGRSPGTNPDHPQVQSRNLRGSIQVQRVK